MEKYEEMESRLMLAKNEKYVRDGTVISAAVYDLWEGKPADCFFLYATDYVAFSEPFARLMIPCEGDEVVSYKTVEECPFAQKCQAPKVLCPDEVYEAYAGSYMAIRDFVFKRELGQEEKEKLKEYMDVFHRLTENNFSACYRELARNFIEWAQKVV